MVSSIGGNTGRRKLPATATHGIEGI